MYTTTTIGMAAYIVSMCRDGMYISNRSSMLKYTESTISTISSSAMPAFRNHALFFSLFIVCLSPINARKKGAQILSVSLIIDYSIFTFFFSSRCK